jgi:hypothetical protein
VDARHKAGHGATLEPLVLSIVRSIGERLFGTLAPNRRRVSLPHW